MKKKTDPANTMKEAEQHLLEAKKHYQQKLEEAQYEEAKLKMVKIEEDKLNSMKIEEAKLEQAKEMADQARQYMDKIYSKLDIDIVKKSEKWSQFSGIKAKFNRSFRPDSLIVCNFELSSGDWKTSVLPIKDGRVFFKKKPYIVTNEFKYYNSSFKLWCLDYHEDISLPIQRKIPTKDILSALVVTGGQNVVSAVNPSSLRTFLMSDVIQSAIKAADISSFFKQVRLLVIIILLIVIGNLLLYLHDNGYLSKLPGVGG